MESWRMTWRDGVAPHLSTPGLIALLAALRDDDPKLAQGQTINPPPLMGVQDWPVEAADAVGYAGWKGDGLTTVGQVEEHFARVMFQCDQSLGEPAACRWWLNWYDDTPRDEMRRELGDEVRRTLADRYEGMIPDGFRRQMTENPRDKTMWGALADWCDDHDLGDMAFVFRSHSEAIL